MFLSPGKWIENKGGLAHDKTALLEVLGVSVAAVISKAVFRPWQTLRRLPQVCGSVG